MKKLLLACLLFSVNAWAAPAISDVSAEDAYVHNTTGITITGTGFGTKDHAAPHLWDDMSGTPNDQTAVNAKWTQHWPNSSGTAANNMQYSTIYRSQAMPNTHTTQYMRGVHNGNSSSAGWNVAAWKDLTVSDGMAILVNWHNKVDASWTDDGDDGNFKIFCYSIQGSCYELPDNWYLSLWQSLTTCGSNYSWVANDDADGSGGDGFNQTGNVFWGANGSLGCPINSWRHHRVTMRVAIAGTNGYIRSYQGGVTTPIVNYSGYMDRYTDGLTRSIGIGGYARASLNANNVRYFWGAYIDYEPGAVAVPHVLLANNATLASATVYEMQIPSAWSDTSITIKSNLGAFSDSGTAYIFVCDSAASCNATGFAVTLSASGEPAPTYLRIRLSEFDGAFSHVVAANDPAYDFRLAVNY